MIKGELEKVDIEQKTKKNNITWVFYYCTFFCATEKKTYTTDYGVFLPGLVEMCVSFVGL